MFYAFIVNPAAGSGFALTAMQKLEAVLQEKNIEYRIYRTEKPGHLQLKRQNRDPGKGPGG